MYRIYVNNTLVHHPRTSNVAITATISEATNTHGTLNVTLVPRAGNVNVRDIVRVENDDGLVWRGRVLSVDLALDGSHSIVAEGALAALCDSTLQPFAFRGAVSDLFTAIITEHNAQMGDTERVFTIGTCTVTDPNNYIYRSSESPMTCWEALTSKLLDLNGGYIVLSGDDLKTINYLSDFTANGSPDICSQSVEFGENLLQFARSETAEGIVNVLYAYGAVIDEGTGHEEEPTSSGFHTWHGSRLHLTGNDFPLKYQDSIDKYGKVVGFNTWDDITLAANLKTAATKWLEDNYNAVRGSIQLQACDLALLDNTIEQIQVGKYVRCSVPYLEFEDLLLCVEKQTDLLDLSQTTFSLGRGPTRISDIGGSL